MPEREGGMRESERERERRERILNKRGRETRSRLRGSVDRIILSLPPPFASAAAVIFQNVVCTVNYTRIIKGTSVASRLGRRLVDRRPTWSGKGWGEERGEEWGRGRVVSTVYKRAKCGIATLIGTCTVSCVP